MSHSISRAGLFCFPTGQSVDVCVIWDKSGSTVYPHNIYGKKKTHDGLDSANAKQDHKCW